MLVSMNGVVPDARRPAPGPLRLVQDFCNSVDFEGGWDDLDTADDLARWLGAHDFLPETPQPPDPELARRAREAFRDLLTVPANHPAAGGEPASRPDRGRAVLGALAADLPLTVVVGETLTIAPARQGLPGALAAMLSALAIGALDGTAARLKVCEADSCRWVFYDESRNGSSRWCSMQLCGARNKNRAYRQRRRAGS
jgi:predicted RNA-binding Zn ribbon-like protein